jgi:hypothetical protein
MRISDMQKFSRNGPGQVNSSVTASNRLLPVLSVHYGSKRIAIREHLPASAAERENAVQTL